MEHREAIEAVFDAHSDVLAAWVFGSVARGRTRAGSDLDVAVLLGRRGNVRFEDQPLQLIRDLERASGRAVDLVVVDDASADLVHRVLRDGVLVCDRDRSARIAFEVKMRHEYFDLAPRLEAYRRAQLARAKDLLR